MTFGKIHVIAVDGQKAIDLADFCAPPLVRPLHLAGDNRCGPLDGCVTRVAERPERRATNHRIRQRERHFRSDRMNQLRTDDGRIRRDACLQLRPLRGKFQHVTIS